MGFREFRRARIGWIAVLFLLVAAFAAYKGHRAPLSEEEIRSYLSQIDAQMQEPGGRHDLPALRRFLESDDGRPFYTVNLYRFNRVAKYLDEAEQGVTGREAYDRFSSAMIRMLAKRSSHPVFGSDWVESESSRWDRIVIVRYRSRRDIADLFASDEFAEASAHKWASIAENERLLVQALHLPELDLPIFLIGIGVTYAWFLSWSRSRGGVTPLEICFRRKRSCVRNTA